MKLHPVSGETRSVPLRKNRAQLLLKIYIIIRMNDHTAEVVTDIYQDISDFFMISQICTHKKEVSASSMPSKTGTAMGAETSSDISIPIQGETINAADLISERVCGQ